MAVTIAVADLSGPEGRPLLVALDEYLNGLYPPEANFLEVPAGDLGGDRGVFLVACADGEPVGCGAIRRLSPTTAEVKRMFVLPAARGRGLGRRILAELEGWAAATGITRLVLETGDRQPEALHLYRRAGFVPVPCFGPYAAAPLSRCFEKAIAPTTGRVNHRI